MTERAPSTPIAARRSEAATAWLTDIDGRPTSGFRIEGGKHVGAIGPPEGQTLARAVNVAVELGIPLIGTIASSGADVTEGVASLHAWGLVARAMARASGAVPTVLVVVGPCVSGPALLLGIADLTVMTEEAFAYVSGPDTVRAFTGIELGHRALGGAALHGSRSGVASLVVADEEAAHDAVARILEYLPANHFEDPPRYACSDPVDRPCARAAAAVPARSSASYDVRIVLDDVFDEDSFLEIRGARAEPRHRPRSPRRAPGRRDRQPAASARRHHRHRSVGEGGALRAVVRLLQPSAPDVRRHPGLRARQRTWNGAG